MQTEYLREQAQAQQKQMQAVYPEVRKELLAIPGVRKVGIGIKEVQGQSTRQLAFRVYVDAKQPLDTLLPEARVPATVRGFPTDVVIMRPDTPEADTSKYRPLSAGIQINRDGGGYGTLGFFATLVADDEIVIVSNHHVLYGKNGADDTEIGQPDYTRSCCCTCGDIAVNVHGIDRAHLDCAIARLKDDIDFVEEIEELGFITGVAEAVSGETVTKRGRTTGVTEGEVFNITFDSGGTKILEIEVKTDDGNERFSRKGDSGSALLNIQHQIIGLHKSGNNTDDVSPGDFTSTSIGIQEVLDAFKADGFEIEVMTGEDDERAGRERRRNRGLTDALWALELRLNESEPGRQLWLMLQRHQKEVVRLVNEDRHVTVAWQRHKGPVFLAALGRSLKEPAYRVPDAVEGVTREIATTQILGVLQRRGSDALAADLEQWGPAVAAVLTTADTVEEMVRGWEARDGVLATTAREAPGKPTHA